MNTSRPAVLVALAFSLVSGGTPVSAGTFQLQARSPMMATNSAPGAHGWANGAYNQRSNVTNQVLQINCQGLATNQIYHLMGSWGTNGALIHVADFSPDHTGSILMQFNGGPAHHFAGTNNPGQDWGMMGDWTNHMSWVVFPAGTNWDCGDLAAPAGQLRDRLQPVAKGMGGMMGGPGTGGTGGMDNHWPQMTNWWVNMTNWSSEMGGWCWNYTNMWNPADNFGGPSTNWWGSLGSGASHRMRLPESVDFVPGMDGIVVMDQNLQPVLVGDMANPDTFVYHVNCALSNAPVAPGASGTLRIAETQRAAHFTMTATGLTPNTRYYLNLDNADLIPVDTNNHGRLRMHTLPGGLTTMRGVGSLSLQDESGTPILSATLIQN